MTNRFAGLPLLIGRAPGSRLDTETTTHSPFRGGAGSGPGTAGVGAAERSRTTQKATKANTAAPDEARSDPFVPPLPIASGQDALEGVRHRLEALDASSQQISRVAHGVTPNASRSDERARCSRTARSPV